MAQGKIYLRERGKAEENAHKPRFSIVALAGVDLKIKVKHVRKKEIEQIANDIGAELVYLEHGDHENDEIIVGDDESHME
jgi:hypothetical protein